MAESSSTTYDIMAPCAGTLAEFIIAPGDPVDPSYSIRVVFRCVRTHVQPGSLLPLSKSVPTLRTTEGCVLAVGWTYRGSTWIDSCPLTDLTALSVHHSSTETRETLTVFGKNSINITKEGLEVMRTRLADDLRSRRKLLLVLDLDHTIVHATVDSRLVTRAGVSFLHALPTSYQCS